MERFKSIMEVVKGKESGIPLVAVHFSFGSHDIETIRHLGEIRQQAERFFLPEQAGKNIYMFENSGMTEIMAQNMKEVLAETNSPFAAIMYGTFGVKGDKLVALEARMTSKLPITMGNTQDDIAHYYFYHAKMLDKLSKSRTFELETESYSGESSKELYVGKKISDSFRFRSFKYAERGNLTMVLKTYPEFLKSLVQSTEYRNKAIETQINKWINHGIASETNTRIFVRFGAGHDTLVSSLENSSANRVKISHSLDKEQNFLMPYDSLVYKMLEDSNYSLTKKDLLDAIIADLVYSALRTMGLEDSLIYKAVSRILEKSNEDELEQTIKSFTQKTFNEKLSHLIVTKLGARDAQFMLLKKNRTVAVK